MNKGWIGVDLDGTSRLRLEATILGEIAQFIGSPGDYIEDSVKCLEMHERNAMSEIRAMNGETDE